MDPKSNVHLNPFSFLLYGKELLTAPARRWLFVTKTCVLILATVESISWAFALSLLGTTTSFRWLLAIATFITFFCFIFMLDSSLITLDRGRTRYDDKLNPEAKQEPGGKWAWLTALKESLIASMIARAVVVSVSIFITAPFFSKMLLARQAKHQMEQTASQHIADKRSSIEAHYDSTLQKEKAELANLEESLPKAIKGIGIPKGRFGFGPVSKELKRQIDEKNRNITATTNQKNAELIKFDRIRDAKDINQLVQVYNIVIPTGSVDDQAQAMKELEKKPDIREYELLFRSFLYVLFGVLVIFKFNEPRSVRIYLSDCLHEHYKNYIQGKYDLLLTPQEYSGANSPLKPHGFEEFMLGRYLENSARLLADSAFQKIVTNRNMLKAQGQELQKDRADYITKTKPELTQIETDLKAAVKSCETLNASIMEWQFKYAGLDDFLRFKNTDLQELEAALQINKHVAGRYGVDITLAIVATRAEIRQAREDLRDVARKKAELVTQQKRILAEIEQLEKDKEKIQMYLKQLDITIEDNFKSRLYWEEQYMRYHHKATKEETGEQGAGQENNQQTDTAGNTTPSDNQNKARQNW